MIIIRLKLPTETGYLKRVVNFIIQIVATNCFLRRSTFLLEWTPNFSSLFFVRKELFIVLEHLPQRFILLLIKLLSVETICISNAMLLVPSESAFSLKVMKLREGSRRVPGGFRLKFTSGFGPQINVSPKDMIRTVGDKNEWT